MYDRVNQQIAASLYLGIAKHPWSCQEFQKRLVDKLPLVLKCSRGREVCLMLKLRLKRGAVPLV